MLDLPLFSEMVLLAGKEGFDRVVTGVTQGEIPNYEYLNEGVEILSTAYFYKDYKLTAYEKIAMEHACTIISIQAQKELSNRQIRKNINEFVYDVMALPLDSNNLKFVAYWLHKTENPIINPWRGSNQKKHFQSFRKCKQSFKNPNFVSQKKYRLSAVGDLMFAKYLEESRDILCSEVEDIIFGADFKYANLESKLTPSCIREFEVEKPGDMQYINITIEQYETLIRHVIMKPWRKLSIMQTSYSTPICLVMHKNFKVDLAKEMMKHNIKVISGKDFINLNKNSIRLRLPDKKIYIKYLMH